MPTSASEPVAAAPAFTVRVLPEDEWVEKLAGTALAGHRLRPAHAVVIVVEHDGQVVACWAAFDTVHVEGLWIHPDHRGRAVVARTLLNGMLAELHASGVAEVVTNADTPEIEALLRRVAAVQLPGSSWLWRL